LQPLVASFLDALDEKMSPIGWMRPSRDKDHFEGPMQGELVPQFSTRGSADESTGQLYFYPSIGMRYPRAVDLEARFLGQPEGARKAVASMGRGLIELFPKSPDRTFERWRLIDVADVRHVSSVLFSDFKRWGIPYIEGFSSVDVLISEMAQAGAKRQDVQRKLAIMCALSGRRTEALEALTEFASKLPEQSGMLADQTYRFVVAFANHFGFGGDLLSA
jgi:hypothetical protein